MVEVSADRAFARWRQSGDATALAEAYDQTAPALLRVAMHLVRHPAQAEDLLQATFVAAMEVAQRYDPARPLIGWLIGILHKQAKWSLRREARRVDPERLPPPRTADPAAQAQEAEFTQQVDEAIERLPEAYRAVLRLHLKHHFLAAEIAHVLDRPAGTVRSQVSRGLEMLREALPAGVALALFAGLATRGNAAVRAAVLARGEQLALGGTAAAVTGSVGFAGGVLMIKQTVLGVLVLSLVALGCWWQTSAGVPPEPRPAASPGASGIAVSADAEASASIVREPAGQSSSVPEVLWSIEGFVRVASGQSFAKASVRLSAEFDGQPGESMTGTTDSNGQYSFDLGVLRTLPAIDLERTDLTLTAWAPGCSESEMHVELPHHDSRAALHIVQHIELASGRTLVGRVVGSDGSPVEGARVEVLAADDEPIGRDAITDPDGGYRLPLPDAGRVRLRARQADLGRAELQLTPDPAGDVRVADLVLRQASLLSARLVFDDGTPVTDLQVRLGIADGPGSVRTVASTSTDRAGRIQVRSLLPGRYILQIRSYSRTPQWPELVTDTAEQTIRLSGLHLVRFAFRDGAGRALHPFSIGYTEFDDLHDDQLRAFGAGLTEIDALPRGPRGAGRAGDGLLASGHWLWIQASHGSAGGEALLQAEPSTNVLDVELRLVERAATATLKLTVRHAVDGPSLPIRASLSQRLFNEAPLATGLEAVDCGAQLSSCAGRFRLRVEPRRSGDDLGSFAVFFRDVELRDGGTTTLAEILAEGGRVRLRVHLPTPVAGAIAGFSVTCPTSPELTGSSTFVQVLPNGWRQTSRIMPDSPMQWWPLLPAGQHELQIRARDYQDLTLGAVVRAGEITDLDVYLQAR